MRLLRHVLLRPLLPHVERFRDATRGNMAISFAIAAVPLIVAVGAAVDYSKILNEQSRLQNATDTAALSIAPDAANLTAAAISAKAQTIVAAALANSAFYRYTVSASYDAATFRTSVEAHGSMPTQFMSIIGRSTVELARTSVAQAEQVTTSDVVTTPKTWPVCLMVTAPSSNHSLFASGKDNSNGSRIALENCMLQVNTANWDAVETDKPSASIIGNNSEFCFHGGYIHNVKNHGTVTTTVNGITPSNTYPLPAGAKASEIASPGVWDSGCPVFADPLQGIPSPLATAACTSAGRSISTTTTLAPGRYCGNITITGGTVTLSPGFYQIDGVLSISGSSTIVRGDGVSIFLNGAAANFDMSGGTVTLSPAMDASAGRLAGVTLYVNNTTGSTGCVLSDGNPGGKSRSTADSCVNNITGGNLTYSGLAYFRYLAFWISGDARVTGNGASLIAEYVATSGVANLSLSGIANASTAAQLLMMQNSQAGYTTTTTVTTTSQMAAKLVR